MPIRLHPKVVALELNVKLLHKGPSSASGAKSVLSAASLRAQHNEVERAHKDMIKYLRNENAALSKEIVTLNGVVLKQSRKLLAYQKKLED